MQWGIQSTTRDKEAFDLTDSEAMPRRVRDQWLALTLARTCDGVKGILYPSTP